MTHTLTTETIKLWRINAEITLGETDELDPENNAAKAILALTEELLANREAQPVDFILGMDVSIDVSTCDADAGHRLFGTVTEISELDGAKNGYILLVQDAEKNFTAPPAPAVPDECAIFNAAIDECRKSDSIDEHAWNHGVLVVMAKFDACRAAMLAQPVSQGCKLPDGFKLMPIEMTDEIGEAIAMEARCCGGIALSIYEAALAAAPEGGNG